MRRCCLRSQQAALARESAPLLRAGPCAHRLLRQVRVDNRRIFRSAAAARMGVARRRSLLQAQGSWSDGGVWPLLARAIHQPLMGRCCVAAARWCCQVSVAGTSALLFLSDARRHFSLGPMRVPASHSSRPAAATGTGRGGGVVTGRCRKPTAAGPAGACRRRPLTRVRAGFCNWPAPFLVASAGGRQAPHRDQSAARWSKLMATASAGCVAKARCSERTTAAGTFGRGRPPLLQAYGGCSLGTV